jgi:hypothetical protein
MSERKSWDVQPVRKHAPAREPKRVEPVKAPARERVPKRVQASAPRPVSKQPPGSLKQRRKRKRQSIRYAVLILLVLLVAAAFYAIWLPTFRVQSITATGPRAETAIQAAKAKTQGAYWFIIPRNSVFFYSEEGVRTAILDAIPEASAVSLSRSSFSSLDIRITGRAKSFVWCGISIDMPPLDGICYEADIEGRIYRPAEKQIPVGTTTQQTLQTEVRIFGGLDRELTASSSPINARVVHADLIPNALKFVDAVRELGAPVSTLAIRGDEADLWLSGPIRITYVLGHEEDAALLAASTLPSISLTDGTVRYIDLRFPGKAYIGRYGQ